MKYANGRIFTAAALFIFALQAAAAPAVSIREIFADGSFSERPAVLEPAEGGALRLRVPKGAISKNSKFLDILSADAEANKGDAGYWILADGRLGHFDKSDGYLYERRQPMPLYGVKKGGRAFVAIVKGLKYEFAMIVEAKGGAYKIFPRFLTGEIYGGAYEDLIIDFHYYEGAAANYSSMGREYRKYQLSRGEVKPLRERVKTQPTLAYTAKSVFFRVKMGEKSYKERIEIMTPENEPKVNVYNTFDDFANYARELKRLGVDDVEMCFVGWNLRGFEGRLPDLFPPDPAFGGEKKMKEAVATAQSLGYQVVCHVCNKLWFSIAERFSFDDLAKNPDGSPARLGVLAGGRAYKACFQRVNERIIGGDIKGMLALGLKGTHHIDVTSAVVPYQCCDPRHPCTRAQTARHMNEVGLKCRAAFGGFGSEGSCDHVANSMDFALYVWAYPDWLGKKNPLMSRLAPIWLIAYHGIILSNPIYSTIDYTYRDNPMRAWSPYNGITDPNILRLKMAEFNGRPVFYFANYKKLGLAPVKEAYDAYKPMRHLQYEFIDFHDEIAKDVFITKFSNGEFIITNYSGAAFSFGGETVPALDYKLFKNETTSKK